MVTDPRHMARNRFRKPPPLKVWLAPSALVASNLAYTCLPNCLSVALLRRFGCLNYFRSKLNSRLTGTLVEEPMGLVCPCASFRKLVECYHAGYSTIAQACTNQCRTKISSQTKECSPQPPDLVDQMQIKHNEKSAAIRS